MLNRSFVSSMRSAPGLVDIDTSNTDDYFREWRSRELSRLEREGLTYADYTGSALYPESLVANDAMRLCTTVYGNPHSEHRASLRSTAVLDEARAAILAFLHASPDEYAVVLTANASAACRLVGESFPFGAGSEFLLTADNHNSVNGIREFAKRSGAMSRVVPLDEHFEVPATREYLAQRGVNHHALFAFPAQSNFTGVRHPLSLITEAQSHGWRVLLDAASYLPTADLRLDVVKPDFVVLSVYKIIGYPGGVGALVARRDALEMLRRPWFAGGTVQWVSVHRDAYRLAPGSERFEDGTPAFTAVGAVPMALAAAAAVGRERLSEQCRDLTNQMLDALHAQRHRNGRRLTTVYAPERAARGPTIAFTVQGASGTTMPYWEIEQDAREYDIAIRGGCFCNPGCAEAAFGLDTRDAARCLEQLGDHFSIPSFADCMDGRAVGALRISFGLGSIAADVEAISRFLSRYLDVQ